MLKQGKGGPPVVAGTGHVVERLRIYVDPVTAQFFRDIGRGSISEGLRVARQALSAILDCGATDENCRQP